jgi:hypothetical protein
MDALCKLAVGSFASENIHLFKQSPEGNELADLFGLNVKDASRTTGILTAIYIMINS